MVLRQVAHRQQAQWRPCRTRQTRNSFKHQWPPIVKSVAIDVCTEKQLEASGIRSWRRLQVLEARRQEPHFLL